MSLRQHWNGVYETKPSEEVSWFEADPSASLDLIRAAGLQRDT